MVAMDAKAAKAYRDAIAANGAANDQNRTLVREIVKAALLCGGLDETNKLIDSLIRSYGNHGLPLAQRLVGLAASVALMDAAILVLEEMEGE